MTAQTPLRKQYLEIKERHRDALVLFRIGDFYEAFDDDARLLARELDIVLTSKPMGKNVRVPLAGVPHHSLERHLATLISRGHRVAICEQLSTTPVAGETGRNLIERDVVRIVTPGTVLEPGLLQSKANNYLAAFVLEGKRAGIAYADVTTGEFSATELDSLSALTELQRIAPSEVIVSRNNPEADSDAIPGFLTRIDPAYFIYERARRELLDHFQSRTLKAFGLEKWPLAASAAGAIIAYLQNTQLGASGQLTRLTAYHTENYMKLDAHTLRSLEIFESAPGAQSLAATLDETRTAMGGRLLRRWLRQPLLDVVEIAKRQEHVAWFHAHQRERVELFAALENVYDLERLSARARARFASAQEILALGQGLEMIPRIRSVLQKNPRRFNSILAALPLCEKAVNLITSAISRELPVRSEKVGMIREGFSDELDQLRKLLRDGKTYLAEMEQKERARTGIRSLRVGYNKVFGYFIEVTRPNLHLVPQDYTRKQTLAQSERFITLELKEYESLVMNAEERIAELETSLFRHLCAEIGNLRGEILSAASSLAYLDVIASFAEVAEQHDYARPSINSGFDLQIKAGRHPVLERLIGAEQFVSNDLELGIESGAQIALITGPNMSGKSTYLRQAALIVLMAQIGSFVPAKEASLGFCDRIFTRIGLYDSLGSGESTFMTEMVETAQILHHATPRSLILLDELGRGTSTFDGLAVARACVEYIHNHPQIQSRTLFATHYYEMTELEEIMPHLRNLHVEIAEEHGELSFLYRIVRGSASKSYGVYAAKLAGLPRPVVRRAEQLLHDYENQGLKGMQAPANIMGDRRRIAKVSQESEILRALHEIDPNALSPVEALMKLFELRKMAERDDEDQSMAAKTA